MVPMKFKTLQELHTYHHAHCLCDLKALATQPVFGDGNPRSQIVFIGEAPGKKEDVEGRPFIGSAGKFLTEMLAGIQMKREDIYITNIVKYRPPNNRDPELKEKEACAAWLIDELHFIQPRIIVFLGRHSMNHFFPEEKISEVHGKLLHRKFDNIPTEYFLPLYHPAAALYNRNLRAVLIKDFQKLPSLLSSTPSHGAP